MIVAWQGWQVNVPESWGPVKVEGDADQGYLLMADLIKPKLGVRWKKAGGRRFKPEDTVRRAMRAETGVSDQEKFKVHALATGQWQSPLLYEDPEPPTRDVWVAYSQTSGRMFEVVCHSQHRDTTLTQQVLPTFLDSPAIGPHNWSVFELSCKVPAGLTLEKHRLNAGDLSLWFTGKKGKAVTVRQIAVAKLALQRRTLPRWIYEQATWRGRYFGTAGEPESIGEDLFRQRIVRTWRFRWMFWLPRGFAALAKHDKEYDRLIVVDANDEALARELMDSVGWTRGE